MTAIQSAKQTIRQLGFELRREETEHRKTVAFIKADLKKVQRDLRKLQESK